LFGSRLPQIDWPLTITADWRPWQRRGLQRSRAGFKECTSRFPARSPYRDHRSPDGQRTGPRHVTFPNLRSGSQPVSPSKDLPSLWSPPLSGSLRRIAPAAWRLSRPWRVVRTHLDHLIASTRRFFLLTGPHTSTALRPLLSLSEVPAPPIPSRTASLRCSEEHRRFRLGPLRSPASDPCLPPQPTQWKRQFLNFFGCPGSAAPPLAGFSRRIASRRLRKLTTSSARASRSRKPAPLELSLSGAQSKIISPLKPPERVG
jgi:hypothetical protein